MILEGLWVAADHDGAPLMDNDRIPEGASSRDSLVLSYQFVAIGADDIRLLIAVDDRTDAGDGVDLVRVDRPPLTATGDG